MSQFASGAEQGYVALIGDVVRSREAADRRSLQRRLLGQIESLSHQFRGALVSPLALFKGDEIQALLSRPEAVVDLVVTLSESISPERLVFGLGYGSLSTAVDQDVGKVDGPCFHQARSAVQEAKADGWLVARGFGATDDAVLTALFTLMGAIRVRWTDKQLAYVRAVRGTSQKSVAEEFGVSPSTVSESLKASSFADLRQGEEAAGCLLRQFGSRAEEDADSVR